MSRSLYGIIVYGGKEREGEIEGEGEREGERGHRDVVRIHLPRLCVAPYIRDPKNEPPLRSLPDTRLAVAGVEE